jgi:two-component system, NtrC family, C4-dicarboxylate transport sensor histidine kinase DctB
MLTFLAVHVRTAWVVLMCLIFSVVVGVLVLDLNVREQQRLSLLQTEAQRRSIEILSTTLNGNLMGSVALLGLIDRDIKIESSTDLSNSGPSILVTLESLGAAFNVEGVFIVGSDGIVKSSWDRLNKPSTGLDVSFRPYYKMALQGEPSVYAAVSMARGERALYFTAPVYAQRAIEDTGIGAVVARTNLKAVDALLQGRFHDGLLLSPQGIVFAGSKEKWIGMVHGAADAKRLYEIRALQQFGAKFESKEPDVLPLKLIDGLQKVDGKPYASAIASIKWNDPSGDWTLLLLEDLSETMPFAQTAVKAGLSGVFVFLLGWLLIHLLRGRHQQMQTNISLERLAREQEILVGFRAQLAALAMELQRSRSIEDLAGVFLTRARGLLGAVQGAIYVVDDDAPDLLRLAGAASCAVPPPVTLRLGEGLLGQCALERTSQIVSTPSEGIWTIRSGLGDAQAAALWMSPLFFQDELVGVLELAVLDVPHGSDIAKLEEVSTLLANHLELLLKSLKLNQLSTSPTNLLEATV